MSYNSANMYAGYNKNANRGALVGNWVEENALEQDTGSSRGLDLTDPKQAVETRTRVIFHTEREEPRDYRSTASDCGRIDAASAGVPLVGPRAQARAAGIASETTRIEAGMEPETDERTFTTSAGSAHQMPPPDWYAENGRLGGGDAGGPTKGTAEAAADAQLEALGDMPVTAYSRAIQAGGGEYVGTAVGGANPLARCTAFTNDIRNPAQRHVGGIDGGDGMPTRMPPSAPQFGAMSRLRRSGAADALEGNDVISLENFCDQLAAQGVSEGDMQLLVSYFDGEGTGEVDMACVREECA